MHLNLVGIELDLVSDFEFLWRLAIPSHLFFALSKHCFDVHSCFFELIKTVAEAKLGVYTKMKQKLERRGKVALGDKANRHLSSGVSNAWVELSLSPIIKLILNTI